MSNISIASLKLISRERLSAFILSHLHPSSAPLDTSPSDNPNLAIIDVRDSDHVGGHIKGSQWVPFPTLDYRIPELVRTFRDKKFLIFHCALSQERGPSAALRYMRERERMLGGHGKDEEQEVFVLDRGFVGWQEIYGEDARLTEAYAKDIWLDY
ncbi:MAG: hypothetical protein M1834_003929 [Cirrosporium novae-zelandiae]|nr:MAG: hypothetical protein M1834_003929 [Cirrosporium novae-zelandiae]